MLAGLGVGLGLRSAVEWEVEQGVVREVKIDSAPVSVDIGLLYRPHQRESPILEAFQCYLSEQLRQYLSQRHSSPTKAARSRWALASTGQM